MARRAQGFIFSDSLFEGMRFFRSCLFLAVLLFPSFFLFASDADNRPAHVAGSFYPADKKELSVFIGWLLSNVPPQKKPQHLMGLIVPHAGYQYSGPIAAYAYQTLEGFDFETVILIGPSHSVPFDGASIWQKGNWETPLGKVEVDAELAQAIAGENKILQHDKIAHLTEHSLEVQIPFLQKILKKFKIVPIVTGNASLKNARLLAKAIVKHIAGKKVLLVISTDMSHFYPAQTADKMDRLAIDLAVKKDGEALASELSLSHSELCGAGAVLTLLEISKLVLNSHIEFLKYANSGDATKDHSRVVGYGAFVFYQAERVLGSTQKKELLRAARQALEGFVREGKSPAQHPIDPALNEKGAAFVTLTKKGELRGCIGHTSAEETLFESVIDNTVAAASRDNRFKPVEKTELKDLRIGISVLNEPRRIKNIDEIVMGEHGVLLQKGMSAGIFLPDVATETGWGKGKFLEELCVQKAGLGPECWKDSAVELSVFTTEVFEEN